MELLQHTTYDEIRSLLGVSVRELKDEVVSLPHWLLQTEQELLDIDGGAGAVLTQFAAVYAVAEGSRTAAQTQFYKVMNMYVLYSLGLQMLARADVFSPTDISDGKASIQRLAERFDKLRPAIEGGLQRLKERLKEALAVLDPSAAITATASRIMVVGAGLGTDPVTGV
jgi:hypothetical protein